MDIVPFLVALAVTALFIIIARTQRAALRQKLGSAIHEVPLHRRMAIWAQWILIPASCLLPAVAMILMSEHDKGADVVFSELVRSGWMITLAYGVRQNSSVLFGELGFAYGTRGFIPWTDLDTFAWDRDNGQREWGYTVTYRRGRRTERLRQYVAREHRPAIDALLAKFAPTATPSSLQPSPVST